MQEAPLLQESVVQDASSPLDDSQVDSKQSFRKILKF